MKHPPRGREAPSGKNIEGKKLKKLQTPLRVCLRGAK
jgi:hypothetical protein